MIDVIVSYTLTFVVGAWMGMLLICLLTANREKR